jgi:hypothetical protein
MWDSSQEEVYFQGIRNVWRPAPSIPLINPGISFVGLLNSFTGRWGGFLHVLIGPAS